MSSFLHSFESDFGNSYTVMSTLAVKVAAIASFLAAVFAYNTNSQTSDNIEDWEKRLNLNRWYIIFEDQSSENLSTPPSKTSTTDVAEADGTIIDPDPLSVIWYLGAFGGLIAFFLVVTFSEWCCASKHSYRRQGMHRPYQFNDGSSPGDGSSGCLPRTPPPPYHLFAPPPYEVASEKAVVPTVGAVYVIPVHTSPLPPPPTPLQTRRVENETTPAQNM